MGQLSVEASRKEIENAKIISHIEIATRTPMFLTQSADDWVPAGPLHHFFLCLRRFVTSMPKVFKHGAKSASRMDDILNFVRSKVLKESA